MYILRTRFKTDIVSEFLPPIRPSNDVVILCGGMPAYPANKELMEFLSEKGYWVFMPRYRGSWESDGNFMEESPDQDIVDIIDELPKGFENLWNGDRFSVEPDSLYLFGSSFGGTAAILASTHSRVTKVLALSPVIDWRDQEQTQSLHQLLSFTKRAFGNGYRIEPSNWAKLETGDFYNPATFKGALNGDKIIIFQNEDDEIVGSMPAKVFARKVGCKLVLSDTGGHLSLKQLLDSKFYNVVHDICLKKPRV